MTIGTTVFYFIISPAVIVFGLAKTVGHFKGFKSKIIETGLLALFATIYCKMTELLLETIDFFVIKY